MRHIAWLAPLVFLSSCAPDYPGDQADKAGSATTDEPAKVAVVAPLSDEEQARLKTAVEKHLNGVKIDAVRATAMPGVYEIQAGMLFAYTSADGRYLIEGDLADLQAGVGLTEASRKTARHALIAKIPQDQSIQFAPKDKPAKYHITVFTDVDCGYCRMFHQHMAEYNADGIAVSYMFFPRSGANTPSFHKAEEVWCSTDRQVAMTQAKQGKALNVSKDCPNPIARHLELAGQLGLRGTPALILDDGEVIPGYQPPDQLLAVLQAKEAKGVKKDSAAAPTAAAPG
ncbi:MAG TPA: DsbC family protein [Nevskiaceae bacterium]|nr:DsbC family protein [Nevskiaceae bacterium]